MRLFGLSVLFASISTSAYAASIAQGPGSCGMIPANLIEVSAKIIGADWPQYRPFMCLYPVKSPAGVIALFVLALNTSKADAADSLVLDHGKPVPGGNNGGRIDPIPPPVVIDQHGTLLATFPGSLWFPSLDPGNVTIRFFKWKNNFPYEFALRVDDPTVGSPGWPYCPPPYLWDAAKKSFIEAPGDFYARCR